MGSWEVNVLASSYPGKPDQEEEVSMRANLTALTKIAMALLFLGVAFAQGRAVAQQSSDMEKV